MVKLKVLQWCIDERRLVKNTCPVAIRRHLCLPKLMAHKYRSQ